ncbi:MAG: site-specific recombinase [Burkholderiaceae bacterium]|nr:site-specific recombinase [Burkholderiaceae bacterium]
MRDLPELLEAVDIEAPLAQRHLWLIELFEWIRGDTSIPRTTAATLNRLHLLLDVVQARPDLQTRLRQWWHQLLHMVDTASLLANFGFSQRSAFVSELAERMRLKLLPATPETTDAAVLFSLVLHSEFDQLWLAELDDATLTRIADLLQTPDIGDSAQTHSSYWQNTVLDALTFCVGHIRASGFSPELRNRMSPAALLDRPFHQLDADLNTLRTAFLASLEKSDNTQADAQIDTKTKTETLTAAAAQFRERLDACRLAAGTVYTHLDEHGISVSLVFCLREMRARVLRIRELLDCLLSERPNIYTAKLLSHLVKIGIHRRSVRDLITSNSTLLAAKMADRSAETGENYITRNRSEYWDMLRKAGGGGSIVALTILAKYLLLAVGFSAFWGGVFGGVNYALSFIAIQLLHWTLATKQPAMTAPAMAVKLKDLSADNAIDAFVDEVTHVVRSQVAAVVGNLALVFPCVLLISYGMQLLFGRPLIDHAEAQHALASLTLLGPTALFAAATGVVLFVSSIFAGWAENWFVLYRLDSAMRYNPRFTAVLGTARAARWARFMRKNISGFAASVSLGMMLGLIPAIASFLGFGLELRHVTLSTGQIAAACAAYGWDIVQLPELRTALLWAVAGILVIGPLNVGVSYYCAFRLALKAHNVSTGERASIRSAIWARVFSAPLSFLWPPKQTKLEALAAAELAKPSPAAHPDSPKTP